jgi:hypothetical protein
MYATEQWLLNNSAIVIFIVRPEVVGYIALPNVWVFLGKLESDKIKNRRF